METRFLKVETQDEAREVAFEVEYLSHLTEEQRVRMVLERSRMILEMLLQDGHPLPTGVSKRT